MRRYKRKVNLVKLSLEDIVEGIKATKPEQNDNLKYEAAMYFPYIDRVYYNVQNNHGEMDFYDSMVHEQVHRKAQDLSEFEVCLSTTYTLQDREIIMYLKKRYYHIIKKHFIK